MAGDHRNRPEFPHGPGVAEYHPVQKPPLDVRECDPEEGLKAACSEDQGRFLLVVPLGLHEGYQLPGDKGKCHEDCRQDYPRRREDDFYVMGVQPWAEPPLETEEKD